MDEEIVAPKGWQEIRKTFFPKSIAAKEQIEHMYCGVWLQLGHTLADGDVLWSPERAILCARGGEEKLFNLKAELFEKEGCNGVRAAIDSLNTYEGHVACPEGYCVVYTERNQSYFLLCRIDKEVTLDSLPGFVDEPHVAVEKSLIQLVAEAGRVTSRIHEFAQGDAPAAALASKKSSLEATAKLLEDKLQKLEKSSQLTPRVMMAEQDRESINKMAVQLQTRIEYLENLSQVVDSGEVQKTAADLQVRVGNLESKGTNGQMDDSQSKALDDMTKRRIELERQAADLADRMTKVEQLPVGNQSAQVPPDTSAELRVLQSQVEEMKDKSQVLEGQKRAADNEIASLRNKLEEVRQSASLTQAGDTATLRIQLEEAEQRRQATIREMEGQKRTVEAEKAALRNQLEEVLAKSNAGQTDSAEKEALARQVQVVTQEMEGQKRAYDSEKAYLLDQLEALKRSANASPMQAELEEAVQRRNAKIQELEGFIADFQTDAQQKINQLSADLARSKMDAQEAVTSLEVQKRTEQARSQQEMAESVSLQSLQSQLAQVSQEKVTIRIEYEKSLKQAEDKMAELAQIVNTQNASMAQLEETVQKQTGGQQDGRVQELMQQVEVLNAEASRAMQMKELYLQAQEKLDVRSNEKNALERMVRDAELRIEIFEKTNSALKDDLKIKDMRIMELTEQSKSRSNSTGGSASRLGSGTTGVLRSSQSSFASRAVPTTTTTMKAPTTFTGLSASAKAKPRPRDSPPRGGSPNSSVSSPESSFIQGAAGPKRNMSAATAPTRTGVVPALRPGRTAQLIQNYNLSNKR